MYDAKVAAELIPYPSYQALLAWLQRRSTDFPARYRRVFFGGRWKSTRVRVLSASEIWRIRNEVLEGPGKLTQ